MPRESLVRIVEQSIATVGAAAIVGLTLAVWAAVSGTVIQIFRNDLPSGAVVAYDAVGGCPAEWSPLPEGDGRFIVGVGKGYAYRDSGGEERVALDIEHMPTHGHDVGPYEWGFSVDGNGAMRRFDVNDGSPAGGHAGVLSAAPNGRGAAHENRPPYLALHLCRKN